MERQNLKAMQPNRVARIGSAEKPLLLFLRARSQAGLHPSCPLIVLIVREAGKVSLGHHQHHVILRRMQGEFPNYRNGFKFREAKNQTNKIQISTNFPLVSNTVKHCCKVMSKSPLKFNSCKMWNELM